MKVLKLGEGGGPLLRKENDFFFLVEKYCMNKYCIGLVFITSLFQLT